MSTCLCDTVPQAGGGAPDVNSDLRTLHVLVKFESLEVFRTPPALHIMKRGDDIAVFIVQRYL